MKVCLSGRQDKEFLKKADEIKLEYRDRRIIPDYAKEYPGANIILELFNVANEDIDWKLLQEYDFMCRGKFYLCVNSVEQAKEASKYSIKFYCGYPIDSEFELQGWINVESAYVILGMPLFFDLKRIKQTYGQFVKIRAIPNIAYFDGLFRENGINGQWIRPEDMSLYSEYIDVFEFIFKTLKQERALYKRYIELQEWPGSLKTIILNFDAEGSNPMIMPETIQARLSCKQKCVSGGKCRICFNAVSLANPEKIKEYAEHMQDILEE